MSTVLKINATSTSPLEELRTKIDTVDTQLITLLEQRAELVFAVGDYKREKNLPIYDPGRETKIRHRVRSLVSDSGSLSANELESIFMALIERYRFFEGRHVQRTLATSLFADTHITFSRAQRVVLWGFGLLGSSFYLALNEILPHWQFDVVDPFVDVAAFSEWKATHAVTNIRIIQKEDLDDQVIYVLGASVETNAQHLDKYAFPEDSFVIDLGSTKDEMTSILKKRQERNDSSFVYVGGHPLAGKETSGFQNGDAMLFYNKTFCWIAPDTQPINRKVKSTCDTLALCLGAKPFWTTSLEHDTALSWTSHLPQLISSVLASCLSDKKFNSEPHFYPGVVSELLRISGSPFSIWKSILSSNRKQLLSALSEFIQKLTALHHHLESQPDNSNQCEELFKKSNDFYKTFKTIKK